MSDDDYAIETTDAGASETIPMEAGQIKKGGCVFFVALWSLGYCLLIALHFHVSCLATFMYHAFTYCSLNLEKVSPCLEGI